MCGEQPYELAKSTLGAVWHYLTQKCHTCAEPPLLTSLAVAQSLNEQSELELNYLQSDNRESPGFLCAAVPSALRGEWF